MLDLIKEYATKRVDLLRLEAAEKSVTILGTAVYIIFALFSVLFFILLLLFGVGFVIGSYLNNYGYGLLIVAGFFLIILIVVLTLRKPIKDKVAHLILESLYD